MPPKRTGIKRKRSTSPYRRNQRSRYAPRRRRNARTGGFNGIELKFIDYEVTNTALSDAWAGGEANPGGIGCLSATAIGDTESSRDGRVYTLKSIDIQGYLVVPQALAQAGMADDESVKLALVLDNQTNATALSAEHVFLAATNPVNSMRNLQYIKRFQVLSEKNLHILAARTNVGVGNAATYSNAEARLPFRIKKSFPKGIQVNCGGSTAVVASITDKCLSLIACSTSTNVKISYVSRVRFVG